MIDSKIIPKIGDLIDYCSDWNRIYDSGCYEPSTSQEWTSSLLSTHFDKNTDEFLLIEIKDSNNICGLIPLVFNHNKRNGIKISNLFPVSEYYNTHSDLLLKSSDYVFIKEFIGLLFSTKQRWDIFRMKRLLETNVITDILVTALKTSRRLYIIKEEAPSFFTELGNSFDEYLGNRSSKFRNHLKRKEKKLNSYEKVTFLTHVDFQSLSDAYNKILYVEKKSWKEVHGTSITSVSRQDNFYRELCNMAFEHKELHLIFLCLDNKPIAYNMGLLKNKTYYYLKTSYSEEFRKLSPSTILRAELIRRLINDGIHYFDFPGEPYEWEKQWADQSRWHKSLMIFNDTLKGRLLYLYYKIRTELFNKDDKKINWCDPLNVKPS